MPGNETTPMPTEMGGLFTITFGPVHRRAAEETK